jgi:hypothetical protein
MDIVEMAVREPGSRTIPAYGRRVRRLATIYALLFVSALVGLFLLVWRSRFLIVLTQRTNVETLTLAFFFVFFLYVASLSAAGLPGALRLLYYRLLAARHAPVEVERRKHAALGRPRRKDPLVVGLNRALELDDAPGEPFTLKVGDDAGELGSITVEGARVTLHPARRDGSNNLLAFLVHQIQELAGERDGATDLEVVQWKRIDNDGAEQYLSMVAFARNLERELGTERLWPTVGLTRADCAELERRMSQLCPALRSESFLPHWEYEGQHKIPIIPEPLGIISLSRSERRVDPEASMLTAAIVVVVAVAVLGYLIALPPWVPGT